MEFNYKLNTVQQEVLEKSLRIIGHNTLIYNRKKKLEEVKKLALKNYKLIKKNPSHISGLISTDGCLSISINRKTTITFGYQFCPEINIHQEEKNVASLLAICIYFAEIIPLGIKKSVRYNKTNTQMFKFICRSLDQLLQLVDFFDKYNLFGLKDWHELNFFKKGLDLLKYQNVHSNEKKFFEMLLIIKELRKYRSKSIHNQSLEMLLDLCQRGQLANSNENLGLKKKIIIYH